MKFLLSLALIILANTLTATAAINPVYKEAMQRGYPIMGDSVLLPDSSKCSLDDFNSQRCGKEFFDLDYCVPEGNYVWDEDACCDGLVPYLPPGVDGQEICRKKGQVDFSETLRNPFLWLGILGFTAVVFGSLLLAKKFIKGK